MTYSPVLSAKRVRARYGSTLALGGVNLGVEEGEVFALIGPNGAGKTTLVRCLTGTKRPDQGQIRLLETDPSVVDPELLGVLPQDFSPPQRLSAPELLDYYGGLYSDPVSTAQALRTVGLEGIGPTRYARLSGGEQRRVDLATTLVNEPDVLFLDEPTTGIDPSGRREVWTLIEKLVSRGTTIFLTTHYMEEAEELADRVGLLADGQLVESGAPDVLIGRYGGPKRLVVKTRGKPERTAEFPYPIEVKDGEVIITGISVEEIGDVVRALEERGISVGTVQWRRPGLEEVFFRLTDTAPNHSPKA